ncbi:MAG: glycosyltransferase family 9 protein [Bacteroidales bacterium]|jgi:heptosyltransferase-2|nr:glycosyltransferase family 9 protein [Bacteroidales bacterium]
MNDFNHCEKIKVLIIQTASIGDVILATPIIEILYKKFPNAIVDVLVKKGNETLFEAHPFLNKTLIWDKSQEKYKNLFHNLYYIRQQKYDIVINVQRFLATGILTVFSKAKITTGFKKNPLSLFFTHRIKHIFGNNTHESDRNLSLISWLVEEAEAQVKLYPSKKDESFILNDKSELYITISPASLWFTKQFSKEQWIYFIQNIPVDLMVYFLGGKDDTVLCNDIIEKSNHIKAKNFAGKLTLLQSAALMKNAQMNFVNDSAAMHLCSAVDAAVTAIFCSTVPAFGFGPLSKQSNIVEIHEKLSCRPCGIHGFHKCPKQHFKCSNDININDLLKTIGIEIPEQNNKIY